MRHMWNTRHLNLERDSDLLLYLFGCASGPLCDHLDIVIRDIRVGFNGQVVERDDAPDEEHDRQAKNHPAVIQSKIDQTANHYCSIELCNAGFDLVMPGSISPATERRTRMQSPIPRDCTKPKSRSAQVLVAAIFRLVLAFFRLSSCQ